MLKEIKCPYCNKALDRGMISDKSALFPEVRYIGCTECGATSIMYKDNITPIMGNPDSLTMKNIKKDIDKAFANSRTTYLTDYIIEDSTDKILQKGEAKTMNLNDKIKEIKATIEKEFPEAKITTFGPKESFDINERDPKFLNEAINNILTQIAEKGRESKDSSREIVKENHEKTTEKNKVYEERYSYTLIDEYGDAYTYQNVTTDELFDLIDKDGHDMREFENMKLYRLENPLTLRVKKIIEIA